MIVLRDAIERVLRDAKGEHLNKQTIAQRLGIPAGNHREAREAMSALEHELFRSVEEHRIAGALPNAHRPEFNFWIEPQSAEAQP